jgi:hypothetical protein
MGDEIRPTWKLTGHSKWGNKKQKIHVEAFRIHVFPPERAIETMASLQQFVTVSPLIFSRLADSNTGSGFLSWRQDEYAEIPVPRRALSG